MIRVNSSEVHKLMFYLTIVNNYDVTVTLGRHDSSSITYIQPCIMRGSRGDPKPPGNNSQSYFFLKNTGPDPLENHKATLPAISVGPSSAHQRYAISIVFRWRIDRGPLCLLDIDKLS